MADHAGLKPRTIRLSDSVWRAVERRAQREQRTVSDFLRLQIEAALKPAGRQRRGESAGGSEAA